MESASGDIAGVPVHGGMSVSVKHRRGVGRIGPVIFAVEKGNFEGDCAVENGSTFKSKERKFESEEHTVRIHWQDQRI